MDHLLYLTHRIPFPPNKGDKIRSHHLLHHLSQRYHVHLGTFIDDPHDWRYVAQVEALCASAYFGRLDPAMARIRSLGALLRGGPLTLDYYRHAGLTRWVAQLLRTHPVERFLVFSAAMAQFVPAPARGRRVIDFVDVDSDKWGQYATSKAWPASLLYRREARQLLRCERDIAARFDAALFVSPAEAGLFRRLAPESADKIDYFSNGVDTDYFSPAHASADPYPAGELPIVFTGAMDYWPNVDAVVWFADAVLPAILARHPRAVFHIVGAKPDPRVLALAGRCGVRVRGRVDDIRPYLAHARVAVAPLRLARGIQNKVLEAMAMAKPVVLSPQALEGIAAIPGTQVMLARDGAEFAALVGAQITRADAAMGAAARALVLDQYGWASKLSRLDACLANTDSGRTCAPHA